MWLQLITILAILELLALLLVANGAPIVLKRLFGSICAQPIDGGVRFADGRPLLGPSKTWRGVLGAVAATSGAASLLGLGWSTGALAALTAHMGDLFSSFTKRRLGIPSSGRALFLDQLPEALLPAFALRGILGLGILDIVVVGIVFLVSEIFLSRILYRLKIRDKPY